jgi:hypothetical protein
MMESAETMKAVFQRTGEGGIVTPLMLIETRKCITIMKMRDKVYGPREFRAIYVANAWRPPDDLNVRIVDEDDSWCQCRVIARGKQLD